MIGWLMRLMPTASFPWLVLHELRVSVRGNRKRSLTRWLGLILLLGGLALGTVMAIALMDTSLPRTLMSDIIILAALGGVFSFMVTQAMIGSQRTLYEVNDLDLLLSAPIAPRVVLAAKLVGIAIAIILLYAALGLPFLLPIAILGHPGLLGFVVVALSAAMIAATVGLAFTLGLARLAGPRAARTVGQIAAALVGGSVFLITQIANGGDRRRSLYLVIYEEVKKTGIAQSPIGRLPGAAAFGDPLAMAIIFGFSAALFALTVWLFQRSFLRSFQDAGTRLSPTRGRAARRGIARLFKPGLFGTIFAKEWRLLARDPALTFQLVLRLVYLVPILLIALRGNHAFPLAPSLAFFSVAVAGQLAGSFAFLTVAAEDSPDLIKVAPVDKEQVDWAKLFAALAMAAPLACILPIAIAIETVPGAIMTLIMSAVGGLLSGLLELKMGKPTPRKSFARRRSGSWVVGLLNLLVTVVVGGIAGIMVFMIGGYALNFGA